MTAKRILSVGQCAADHYRITRTFQQAFGAEVVEADTTEEALALLRAEPCALVLVNRVFDLNGGSGVAFIKQLKSDAALQQTPIMLVSNYEDAQQQALAAGALPGFGKAALGAPLTLERVKEVLEK